MARGLEIESYDKQESAGILIHSRTVVESADFVSTGILSYAEGDVIEIEIAEHKNYVLGSEAKVTIYSPGGIYMIQTSIVAKDDGSIVVLNPPANQKRFVDRRENPRVKMSQPGFIHSLSKTGRSDGVPLEEPHPVHVQNISITGIGFLVTDGVEMEPKHRMKLAFELGSFIECSAEVIRREEQEQGMYYGARFLDIPKEKVSSLRAFILRTQVEERLKMKKQAAQQRNFR